MMKKITVENYEAYFLDYIEGNLDASMTAELKSFLILYPHLKGELEQAELFRIQPKTYTFDEKQVLKKFEFDNQPITHTTFADFCIAAHEGILSEHKKEELSNYLQTDTSLFKDYITYGKTHLKAEIITFPDKSKLYHKTHVISLRKAKFWFPAAASIALLFTLYFGYIKTKPVQQLPNNPVIVEKQIVKKQSEAAKYSASQVPILKNKQPVILYKKKKLVEKEILSTRELAMESQLVTLEPLDAKLPAASKIEQTLLPQPKRPTAQTELPSATDEEGEKRKLLALVETGLSKINDVTNTNLELAHKTTSTGQIKTLSIKAGFFEFERKKARN